MYLSVIIPAYNEEKYIAKTIREVDQYLKKQNYQYEIIVVNDGSKDKTAEIVRNLSFEIKNLKLIDNKINQGKGFVVRQGMLAAKGNFRIFMDADNKTSIDQIEKMWPEFEKGYEVIIGSRKIKGSKIIIPQPLLRKKQSAIFNLLVKIILNLWGIRDTQCGFKGFTKKAAENIFPKCKIDRFAFDVEILVIAKKMGFKIKEIPVSWVCVPGTTVKLKNMIKMGLDLLKIKWNLITGKYQ